MIRSNHKRLGIPHYILYPGDHFTTKEKCAISTVAGRCVVVCLNDLQLGIGGMGHFIIPGMIGTEGIIASEIARAGIIHLEYIMADFVKLGGDRKKLTARVFGAGLLDGTKALIVKSNIDFIKDYFKIEGIPVIKEDLGGTSRREILFLPHTGNVYRKTLQHNADKSEFIRLENEYIDKMFKGKDIKTNYVLFE